MVFKDDELHDVSSRFHEALNWSNDRIRLIDFAHTLEVQGNYRVIKITACTAAQSFSGYRKRSSKGRKPPSQVNWPVFGAFNSIFELAGGFTWGHPFTDTASYEQTKKLKIRP